MKNVWRNKDHFQKGEQTILWDTSDTADDSGYPRYRVQKWEGEELILVKTYKGELGEMNSHRLYNDLVMGLVYA
jgi:hypothetical protein